MLGCGTGSTCAARDMGRRLAAWTLDHSFQPIHKHEKG
jgi:hypothetical protein